MGRPKHHCDKPEDPYIQFVAATTTTTTTQSPVEELGLIKYPSDSNCPTFENQAVLDYFKPQSISLGAAGSCQFTLFEPKSNDLSKGSIISLDFCEQLVSSNRLITRPIWYCLNAQSQMHVLSGQVDITDGEECDCEDTLPKATTTQPPTTQPPTTQAPVDSTTTTTTTPAPDFTVSFVTSSATATWAGSQVLSVTDTFRMGLTLRSSKYEQHERYIHRMEQGYHNHIWKLVCVPYLTSVVVPLPPPRIGSYYSNELDWDNKVEVDINIYLNEGGIGSPSLVNKEQIIQLPDPFAYSNPGVAPPLSSKIAWRIFIEEPWFGETLMARRYHYGFQIVGHTDMYLKEPDYDLYPPPF